MSPEIVEPIEAIDPELFRRTTESGHLAIERSSVTNTLFERLDDEDIAEVERRIGESAELSASYAHSSSQRVVRHLILSYGVYLGVSGVLEKTGLSQATPPESVHAMSRGPLAAAGGLYEGDFIIDALASAGVDMQSIQTGLDFGCSSGRVVRALAAAFPNTKWWACDPNQPAITWAQENLSGIEFFHNDDNPPLKLEESSLDLACAVSIWSHFEPQLGLLWFQEMHRLIRPGGHLVFTTHGPTAVGFYATNGLRTPEQSKDIAYSLYRQGWWYVPEFGEAGDWGVVNPEWGTSFLSPEWVITQLCPRWRVLEFAPGRNQENQDLYVLQRV